MKTMDQERLRLAAVIREEMECLQTRVLQSMRTLKGMTDRDIADKVGSQLPRLGDSRPAAWLEQPLEVIRDATTALRALNLSRYRELERERERKADLDLFGADVASP